MSLHEFNTEMFCLNGNDRLAVARSELQFCRSVEQASRRADLFSRMSMHESLASSRKDILSFIACFSSVTAIFPVAVKKKIILRSAHNEAINMIFFLAAVKKIGGGLYWYIGILMAQVNIKFLAIFALSRAILWLLAGIRP